MYESLACGGQSLLLEIPWEQVLPTSSYTEVAAMFNYPQIQRRFNISLDKHQT